MDTTRGKPAEAATRANFYVLLELDSSIQEWSKIETVIRSKRSEWSRDASTSPAPKRKRQASQNMALVPELERVMKDPELRRKEAEQAKELRKELHEQSLRDVRQAIANLSARGYLFDKEVQNLVKRYAREGISEDDIRREVTVDIRADSAASEPALASLDKTLLNQILANLETLNCNDLYAFLGKGEQRGVGCEVLIAEANKKAEELRREIKKTAEFAARQELVGLAKSVFASDEKRRQYDQSLADAGLNKIETQFGLLGGDTIDPKTFQMLLEIGLRAGAKDDRCRQKIREMAKSKGLYIEKAVGTNESFRQCGNCLAINATTASACNKCGQALQISCPSCKMTVPSTHFRCTGCGFPIGNLPEIQTRLSRATAHLGRGELVAAQAEADGIGIDCVPQHPTYPPLQKLKESISGQRRSHEEAVARIQKLVGNSQIDEAGRLLNSIRVGGPTGAELSSLKAKIGKALSEAEEAYKAAVDADRRGKRDDVFDHCCRALVAVSDYQPARQLIARFPPEAPSHLDGTAAQLVCLSWQPSPSRGVLEYKIVRKEGARPSNPNDGKCVGIAKANRFDDSTAEPGVTYFYGVVAVRAGVESACCLTGPLMPVVEVADLSARAGDKCVEISWQLPQRAVAVEVWRRSGAPPQNRGEGERIEHVRRAGATDHDVSNGSHYGYLVVAVYRAADGSLHSSGGVALTTKPEAPAQPLMDLAVRRDGPRIMLTWQKPSHGTVEVYRLPREPSFKIGQHCDTESISSLGKKVAAKDATSAEDSIAGQHVAFYLPVTVTGSVGVIGRGLYVTSVDDVTDLQVTVRGTTMLAKWMWPPDCRKCRVAIRTDQFPSGPDDPLSLRDDCLHAVYESKLGAYYYPSLPAQAAELFVTVYAAVSVGDRVIYASGSERARKHLVLGAGQRRCELRYSISAHTAFFTRQRTIHVTIAPGLEPIALPELCVVAKPRTVPTSAHDGIVLASLPKGTMLRPGHNATFKFSPGELPKDTLARLFMSNESEADWLVLVPDKARMNIGS